MGDRTTMQRLTAFLKAEDKRGAASQPGGVWKVRA